MAITPAQRTIALQFLLPTLGNDAALDQYLPGASSDDVITVIQTAIGAQFDTELATVLASLVAQAESNLTAANANVVNQQSNIAAWTIV